MRIYINMQGALALREIAKQLKYSAQHLRDSYTELEKTVNNNIEGAGIIRPYFENQTERFIKITEEMAFLAEAIVPYFRKTAYNIAQYVRQQAVDAAWAKEAERVRNGKGTWDWTVEQQAELLTRGSVSGFEGSHILNAKDYPEQAGNPDNIQLIPIVAHYDGVHKRNTHIQVNGVYHPDTGEVTPIEDGKIPELPVIQLTNRYDPDQHQFHDTHPGFEQSGKGRWQSFKATKERHPEKSLKCQKVAIKKIFKLKRS